MTNRCLMQVVSEVPLYKDSGPQLTLNCEWISVKVCLVMNLVYICEACDKKHVDRSFRLII